MPQEQKQPKKQRDLTPQELETAASFTKRYTPEQIKLIWQRKMPVDSTLSDFQWFMYVVESRDLDPLLSEVYCRRQFDRDSGEYRLLLLDGYHGLLKLADKTGQLNGINTTFQEAESGDIISATTTVWRKGCDHPFEFTAYWGEFVGMSNGKPSYMWATKGRIMLGKCAASNALRLAFAAALAGVYVPEELDHTDSSPEPNSEFAVGEIKSEVETVVEPSVQRLDPDVTSTSTPGPETGIQANENSIAQPKEKIDAPAMPINEVKQKNQALAQRVLLDLQIDKLQRQPLLTAFYRGWLALGDQDALPKEPALYTPPLVALCAFSDEVRGARIEFVADAKGLGAKLRADREF